MFAHHRLIKGYTISLGILFSAIDAYREYSKIKSRANKINYTVFQYLTP